MLSGGGLPGAERVTFGTGTGAGVYFGDGIGEGVGIGVREGVADALGDGVADEPGEGNAEALGEGVGDSPGEGAGVWADTPTNEKIMPKRENTIMMARANLLAACLNNFMEILLFSIPSSFYFRSLSCFIRLTM